MKRNKLENSNRLIFLDLLRLIAVISVLGVHQYSNYLVKLVGVLNNYHLGVISYIVNSFFNFGLAGVCIFFFVSGFAITIASNRETSKEFIIRRFFRIFPLYLIASILEEALISKNSHEENFFTVAKNLILNLTMLGDYTNTPANISGVAWTLRIEILFYVFFWIIILIKEKFQRDFKHYMFLALVFIYGFLVKIPTGVNMGNRYYVGIFLPILIIGSLCASVYHREKRALSLVLILLFLGLHLRLSLIYRDDFFSDGNYFLAVAFIVSFVSLLRLKTKGTSIVKLARYTYSFYLFHTFLLSGLKVGLII